MKLTWKNTESFIKSPDPAARVVLLYGPDDGLMRERAACIGKTVTPNLDDPFNVAALTADILITDPSRLQDEALALSMMGGARLIRIEDGGDKLTPLIKDYLAKPSLENLVIIEAGELGTKSSLRALCEKEKNAAAIACYIEDERAMTNFIRETLAVANLKIDSDAAQILSASIIGDRARARSEIEKLITYMISAPKPFITSEDIMACCVDTGATNLDDLVYAVGSGQARVALATYNKLMSEGVADIAILRSLQSHFRKLHYVIAQTQQNIPLEEAMKTLKPPIFYKFEDAFKAQTRKWSLKKLDMVLSKLLELEAQTKKTGAPVETLCAQAVLSLSMIR